MRSFRSKYADATLRYHQFDGTGIPLVIVHGLGGAGSLEYRAVAADAALAGRRVLLLDLLGSGHSDRPRDFGYGVEDHAQVVAELVDALDIDRVVLFGHSFGGAIAIDAAERLNDRIEGLVLAEPNLKGGGGLLSRRVIAFSETDYVAGGHEALANALVDEGQAAWASIWQQADALAVHRGACSLVAGSEPSWRDRLASLDLQRTLILGQGYGQDEDVFLLASRHVAVRRLERTGHFISLDDPRGLARELASAMDRAENLRRD